MVRTPIEFPLASGLTVRGVRLGTAEATRTIVQFHDVGADLDEFGSLPESLVALGFDVVAVDLPGHGLSDGDEPSPGTLRADVEEILAGVGGGRPLGLVSSGRAASVASSLGAKHGVRAQLLVAPVLDDEIAAGAPREHAIRMVIHGDGPNLVGTETQRFFSHQIGEKLLLFNASTTAGAAAVLAMPTVLAHVEMFFRRYLAPARHPDPPTVRSSSAEGR